MSLDSAQTAQGIVIGLHLNYVPGSYRPYLDPSSEITSEEEAFLAQAADWYDCSGAYAHLQATKPQTPAYALNDSPCGSGSLDP
jgi:hypothetical protein